MMANSKADDWERTERRLDAEEVALLSGKAAGLGDLLRNYKVRGKASNMDAAMLDKVFSRWLLDRSDQKLHKSELATLLGAAFGNLLCKHWSMQWVELSDNAGITYAVRHRDKAVYCFPFEVIMKRIAGRDTEFLVAVVQAVANAISDRQYVVRRSYDG
jgi:hypothetical protein